MFLGVKCPLGCVSAFSEISFDEEVSQGIKTKFAPMSISHNICGRLF